MIVFWAIYVLGMIAQAVIASFDIDMNDAPVEGLLFRILFWPLDWARALWRSSQHWWKS